jgi:hypothetical protein
MQQGVYLDAVNGSLFIVMMPLENNKSKFADQPVYPYGSIDTSFVTPRPFCFHQTVSLRR